MKLEPVYVVAPLPEQAESSRRRWCLAVAAAFLGAAGGVVVGFSAAGATRSESEDEGAPPDPELLRLRRLVSEGTTEELLRESWNVLLSLSGQYADDEVLWRGLDRIVEANLLFPPTDKVREILRFAATMIERSRSEHALRRLDLLPTLKVR